MIVGASVRYIEKRLCTSLELKNNRGRPHSVNSYYIQIMPTIYNRGLKRCQFTLGKVALNFARKATVYILSRFSTSFCSLMSNALLQTMRISQNYFILFD